MINLIFLLVVPAIGMLFLILKRFYEKLPSPEVIALSAMIVNAVLFAFGLIFGFSAFNININQSISFSFSLQENFITIPFLLLAITVPIGIFLFATKEVKQSKAIFYLFYLLVYVSVISVFVSSNLIVFYI